MGNKYPYIGKCDESLQIVLFTKEKCGITLFRGRSDVGVLYKYDTGFNEREFTNITNKYLRNTKVRIENTEHSEFVQLLAEIAGYCRDTSGAAAVREFDKAEWIYFCNEPFMSTSRPFDRIEYKEIFLPRPPKKEVISDEWPKVGDEVSWGSHGRYMGVLLCKHNNLAWVEFKDDTFGVDEEDVLTINLSELIKPASPQENELVRKLIKAGSTPSTGKREREIAQAILLGEIEGLEYKKPQ